MAMAYVFLDDGSPEASDCDSNYFYFNESHPPAFSSIQSLLSRGDHQSAQVRTQLRSICQSSLNQRGPEKKEKSGTGSLGSFAKFVYHLLF